MTAIDDLFPNDTYDIFIPVAPKDLNKIPFLLDSIKKHLEDFANIHLCTPVRKLETLLKFVPHQYNIFLHAEEDLLSMDLSKLKYRPNWIYQQYLKLFQNVTQDLFLTVDSDVLFNRKLPLFTEGKKKRIIYSGWEQNWYPYFAFQAKALKLLREFPRTGICDLNFMDRKIIHEMLKRNNYTVESFIEKTYEIVDEHCYPAEPEIWIQYANKYHSDKYEFIQAKVHAEGREQKTFDGFVWTEEDIKLQIAQMEHYDFDLFMLHSWFTNNEAQK